MVSACDGPSATALGRRGRPSIPPTSTAEKIRALCGKSRPSRIIVVDVQGRGRIALSQRRRSSSPPGVRPRNPAATAAGASARDRTGHACLPHPCPEEDLHGPACVPARRARVERWTVASGGDRHVTSTMPYVRCIRCAVRCFSAARWSNVEQCGVCGADLPRRPVDSRAAVPRLHPVRTASLVLPAAVPDEREVAVMTSDGVGPTDGSTTRRLAARAARSA